MSRRERLQALWQWTISGLLTGLLCGGASALFLWLLEEATSTRQAHPALVFFLPVAGLAMGLFLERFGSSVLAGNNLVIDTIHDNGPELPLRMAPLVLLGTVLTHLFGGSAGREGTAVQMGASLTDWLSHRLRLTPVLRRQLLAAGVAGGFGSVFGTPVAGVVFGLEFVVLGRIEYDALIPAMIASFVGDAVTRFCGIRHSPYPVIAAEPLTAALLAKWIVFAAAAAVTSIAFIECTHAIKKRMRPVRLPFRMALGGAAVLGLWLAAGTDAYLGLGVPTILASFDGPLPMDAFAWKLIFTMATLGFGFMGGEVTPLFFVGAALGNALAQLLGVPLPLGAAVGLTAVFATASNTPLALSIMAVELFGGAVLPHAVIVCVLGYVLTGHRSIYPSQRLILSKAGHRLERVRSLQE
ncbi:MAG TPA: chloride channel protein [Bryobacteraceae bacterium]|nr:chloride channel protein [Bryobacteraceae bacterium]